MNSASLTLAHLQSYDSKPFRTGGTERYLCPFCSDDKPKDNSHRTLSLHPSGGYHCFRCGNRGKLGSKDSNWLPPAEWAAKREAERAKQREEDWQAILKARKLFKNTRRISGTPGVDYLLNERKLRPALAAAAGVRFTLSWAGSPALVFPGKNRRGEIMTAQGRYLAKDADPRMRTYGKALQGIFATFEITAVFPPVIAVTEAPLDALSYYQLFGVHAVASLGCWQQKWLPALCRDSRVILATDNDKAGEEAAARWSELFKAAGVEARRRRPRQSCKDWNDVLRL